MLSQRSNRSYQIMGKQKSVVSVFALGEKHCVQAISSTLDCPTTVVQA